MSNKKIKKDKIGVEEKLYLFEQAFRIYQKVNEAAKRWDAESVQKFCFKKMQSIQSTVSEWTKYFNSY